MQCGNIRAGSPICCRVCWHIFSCPQHYGPNVTMIGALSLQGLDAVMTVERATGGRVPGLCRAGAWTALWPGDVVIMDNLRAR